MFVWSLSRMGVCPTVSWCLPASKADLKAEGVERTHYCECVGTAAAYCPVCAMRARLEFLAKAFPGELEEGKFKHDVPLFPDALRRPCTKDAMADTFASAARYPGLPTTSLDGSEVVSGHSLRVTGAQGLSRLGLGLCAIQLLGRWAQTRPARTSAQFRLTSPPDRLPRQRSVAAIWRTWS